MKRLVALFLTFFRIGLFTFGGGYGMIPLIRREVIDRKGWVAEQDFMELLTLAQSAPGPIALNTSVFIGYRMAGLAGATAAVLGVVVPSFTILLAVALFFSDIRTNPTVDAAFRGMRPAVVALIVVPVLTLARGMGVLRYLVAAATAVAVWYFTLSPVLLIFGAAVTGLLLTALRTGHTADRS